MAHIIWVHMSLPTYDQKWSLMDNVGIEKEANYFHLEFLIN